MIFFKIFHRNPFVYPYVLCVHLIDTGLYLIVINICLLTVLENMLVSCSYIAAHEERISVCSEYSSKNSSSSSSMLFCFVPHTSVPTSRL
jgi:hypothetical protein